MVRDAGFELATDVAKSRPPAYRCNEICNNGLLSAGFMQVNAARCKTANGPWIREITKTEKRKSVGADGHVVEKDYSWTTYLVQGWKEEGKWQRRSFQDEARAKGLLAELQVRHLNDEVKIKQTFTAMSSEQVKQAESAFRRLGDRYTLDTVIDFFVRHHYDTEKPKDFKDAIEEFQSSKKQSGLQPRSLRQLKSTLDRFFGLHPRQNRW
jgi:hypothetical protein